MRELEVQVCSILQGDTGAISALRILHLYLERMGCDFQVRPWSLTRLYRGRGQDSLGYLQAAAMHPSQLPPFSSAS